MSRGRPKGPDTKRLNLYLPIDVYIRLNYYADEIGEKYLAQTAAKIIEEYLVLKKPE